MDLTNRGGELPAAEDSKPSNPPLAAGTAPVTLRWKGKKTFTRRRWYTRNKSPDRFTSKKRWFKGEEKYSQMAGGESERSGKVTQRTKKEKRKN